MKKLCLACIIGLLAFSSCNPTKVYEQHIDVKRMIWNRFDVKSFTFDITDISTSYDFYIAIRHHTEIPIDDITVKFILYAPSGEVRILEDRIIIRDQEGHLVGDGMGNLWDLTSLAREDYRFTEPGACKVEISSAMSKADLPGIMQVGLIVKKNR